MQTSYLDIDRVDEEIAGAAFDCDAVEVDRLRENAVIVVVHAGTHDYMITLTSRARIDISDDIEGAT